MKSLLTVVLFLASLAAFGQSKLKPHHKGYDIFALDDKIYITRSDIGLYLVTKSFDGTGKSEIFPLNESLANAEAYVGFRSSGDWKRCVIRDDSYTMYNKFTSLKGERKLIGSDLAKNADHYFAKSPEGKSKSVYVIKGSKYHIFDKLSDSKPRKSGDLPKYLQTGDVVAYWAREKFIYILKNTKNGPMVYRTEYLKNQSPSSTVSAPNEAVRNFLIGGLTVKGSGTRIEWESVHPSFPFCNNGSGTVAAPKITESITTGVVENYTSSIEKNWSISSTVTTAVGNDIASAQVELTASYGGASVKTNSREWSESNTSSITLDEGKQVAAGTCVGYWQGKMYINEELVMTSGIVYTDNGEKPKGKPNFHIKK